MFPKKLNCQDSPNNDRDDYIPIYYVPIKCISLFCVKYESNTKVTDIKLVLTVYNVPKTNYY